VGILTRDNVDQSHRDLILDGFRSSAFAHLITTNVLARGVNVPQVCISSEATLFFIFQSSWFISIIQICLYCNLRRSL
jgi:late competence protein required for DNA uptake (superfamily II DNA/RNA helicase)